jgi:lysine 2,3-aminomutase
MQDTQQLQSQTSNNGSLPELMSPYIKKLIAETGGPSGPIGKQFILTAHNVITSVSEHDAVIEGYNEIAPSMYYKYKGGEGHYGRVLWTITRYCATYCRFCTRGRLVGLPSTRQNNASGTLASQPFLSQADLDNGIAALQQHPEINEVILSGGDPLVTPKNYLTQIVNKLTLLQKKGQINIIRIHTRMPITNPGMFKVWHLELLKTIHIPRIVLHINHPSEITPEVERIVADLLSIGAQVLSQGVLLKGVNDNALTLVNLFNKQVNIGIIPYYLHQNDDVSWAQEFTVPMPEAIELWQSIRPKLSGLASSAKFVIDGAHLPSKIPLPDAIISNVL